MSSRTHYDVLGVAVGSTSTTVRDAYRRLARQYHPDHVAASAAGGDRMAAINEAYRVLSDPGRRAVYDASLRTAAGGTGNVGGPARTPGFGHGGSGVDEAPEWRYQHPPGPARVPWRGLLVFAGVAIVAIVVLAQFTKPSEPAPPDNIMRAGDCVEILPNTDAKEVACTGAGDLVVRQFISFDRECSLDYARHRDRQGMGVVCVEQLP